MLRLVREPNLAARPGFAVDIARAGRTPLERCNQCSKCTAGCPVAFAMDYKPNQITHMVHLGLADKVLDSNAIWLCASCETCTTRCPMEIDLAAVMDALRQEATRRKKTAGGKLGIFHDSFLDSVRRHGRAHEIELVGFYKMKSRDFFSDLGLGIKMFLKRRFRLLPQRVKGLKEVRESFRQ